MPLVVVRHADAGRRSAWRDEDRVRPLTKRGHRQAEALVASLAPYPVGLVVSSPARRCIQTLAPLAAMRGVSLEVSPALATDAPLEQVHALLRRLADDDVALCTHREVLEQLLPAAVEAGAKLNGRLRWPKASAWLLEVEHGAIRRARYLPAPVLDKP